MQDTHLPPEKKGAAPRAARRVLAGAVVTSLFIAPCVTAAYAAPNDSSEALGRAIDLNLLTIPVADAGYAYSGNQSSPDAVHAPLNVSALGAIELDLGPGLQLPLIGEAGTGLLQLGQAGVLNSYAEAATATSAKAGAGAVSSNGGIALDAEGSDSMTANVDLTKLLKQLKVENLTDSVIDEASLEIGALGSTAEKSDGTLKSEYLVAGAEATISSPAVEGLTTSLGGVVDGLGTTLNTTLSSDGVLGTITSGLNAIDIDLRPLARIGITESKVALDGVDAALDQVKTDVLQGVVTSKSGLVSIDLGTGDVSVDLSKVTTGGLNGKSANYELLSAQAVQEIADEVTSALSSIVTDLRDALVAALDEIDIVVDLGLEARLALPLAEGTANIRGSVASFLGLVDTEPTTTVDLKLLGLNLGELITPLVKGVVGVVRGAIGPVLNPVVDGLAGTITGVVSGVTDPLEPVLEGVLNEIVEITLNEQGKTTIDDPNADPDSTQEADYVTALSVTLLPAMGEQANKVSLARSEVRADDEVAPVDILTPGENTTVPIGDLEVTGTGQAGTTLDVALDNSPPQKVTVGEDGTWNVIFLDVPAGSHTVTATDGSTEDSVSFTAEDDSTTDATADASSDAQADAEVGADTAGADTNSDADANADAQADANADAEAGADSAGADAQADANADAEAGADSAGADAQADANADAEAGADSAGADTNADAQADANVDAEAGADAQADAEAGADTAGADTNADAQADANVDAEAGADAQADAEAGADTAGADTNADVQADANVDAEADAEAGADTNADAASSADANADAQADANVDAEAGADAQADAEAGADTAGADTNADAASAADANVDAEAGADSAGADTNADAQADANVDAETGADSAGADTNADAQADADGDTDGNYEPVGITSPKENAEVEGPSIVISGVSDPNAKVTVTVARVPEGAAAKAAVTDPQQQIDADDKGNWSVTVAGVEAGKYTAHAADGRTEDTTTFVVYDPAAESDSDSSATEGGSDSSATEGGSDSSATEGGSDSSATEGASDSSSTEANASADGKDDDSSSKHDSDGKKDELADTGANGVLIAAGAALMLALAGAGILFARRKKA
ncbi:choice-of-anchor G family protein [Arthrobacter sp. YC-RL1]|uniref:choice-of-anchor G family protein n=1 Tax=Arthrobacter sp. YC-RL1 TaxID=1652545 RepID=UPI00128E6222|nr:choice-of-anchor G family protein [Arthrobacter sp. YC-RL1]